jgi:hypothetical protein
MDSQRDWYFKFILLKTAHLAFVPFECVDASELFLQIIMKSVFLFAITFYLLYFIQAQKTCVKINECEVEASLIEYHGQDALLQDQLKDRLAK